MLIQLDITSILQLVEIGNLLSLISGLKAEAVLLSREE